jgi:tetratricopeptide (TPR) repeat protein
MAEVALRDYLNEIDNLIDHGSIEAALQHSRHILLQYPKAVEVYRLMGKALLEREDDRAAQDVFQRVLSVDPEDFVARVGLSIVHDRNNEVDQAVWHMERAFDIAPSNALIQGELRRLYARRDGAPPDRIPLTRDALARMYAQGDLNAEAIADLRELLHEQPDRIDLQVEMAEVLWRDEQRVDASELTQKVLNTLPYCLKANLIIGAILHDSGANGESGEPFQRAQAVDPENVFAAVFFSGQGPLVQQPVLVDRLDLQTVSDMLESEEPVEQTEAVPEWLRGVSDLEQPLLPESELEHAPRLAAGLHMPDVATEIPDWLQGLTAEPGAAEPDVPDWLATLTGAAVAGVAAQALTDREKAEPEELAVGPTDEETPDWISQLGSTGTLTAPETIPPDLEDEQPDWMAQLRETPLAPYSETIPASEDSETPDWLAALAGAAVAGAAAQALTKEEEAAPEEPAVTSTDEVVLGTIPPAEEDEQPAWMVQLREAPPAPYSETIPVSEDTQAPDWLAEVQASVPPLEETPADEEPDWLTQLRASRGEVATEPETSSLDFGKAAVGAVGLAGLAGAALFAGREGEDEEAAAELEVPASTAVEPTPAVSFGVAEPPTVPEVPEEMPSADDALAFLAKLAAGKEDQLRAQAHEEADLRMDAIMGRKPAEPKPAEPTQEGKPAIRLATTGAAAAGLVAAATKLKNKLEEPEQPTPSVAAVASSPEVPEEMPSADDALAFLTKLAAGKEVQLQAEAQREADVRMAAIMGRKPVEPVAESPQPVEPAASVAGTAEVPEEMPSADDALAFLAKLASGKEDQLRAEAQLEADARMDAIMGRKLGAAKPTPEEKPGAGLAAAAAIGAVTAAGLAATKKEEPAPPAEVPQTMPSADDALAFLSKLAAGKEDQLRAQAEQEAEVRMAAIMGRSAPLESAKTIEPETLPALEIETDEPVPANELPDWLQEMSPSSETVMAEPGGELPEWLRAMRPDESTSTPGLAALFEEESETELEAAVPATELPDWLRSMQPGTTTDGLTLESLTIEDEEIEAAVTPTSELPDWLRSIRPTELEETVEEEETSLPLGTLAGAAAFGLATTRESEESVSAELEPSTEELLAELAALERAASVAEIEPAQTSSIVLSQDWWVQAAEDTDEEPLQGLPDPFLSPRARAAEKERERAAVAAEKPKSEPSALPQTGPLRLVQTGPLPQTGPLVMPESVAPSPEVESLVARVSGDQKDYAARLELARTYWATGNREGAYTEYLELANAGEYTKELISDLETIVEIHDLPDWHRMLGDVCMKAGKLSQALVHYRVALNEL